jgi:hypothetical protein
MRIITRIVSICVFTILFSVTMTWAFQTESVASDIGHSAWPWIAGAAWAILMAAFWRWNDALRTDLRDLKDEIKENRIERAHQIETLRELVQDHDERLRLLESHHHRRHPEDRT